MKEGFCVLIIALFGVVLGAVLPRQVNGQTETSKATLVRAMRTLNNQEYSYREANGRFAAKDELLQFLQKRGELSSSPIDLQNPKPYELEVTTTTDGMHYQITLERPSDMQDKSTWCKPAAFTDERGVIYLGLALDCEAAPQ